MVAPVDLGPHRCLVHPRDSRGSNDEHFFVYTICSCRPKNMVVGVLATLMMSNWTGYPVRKPEAYTASTVKVFIQLADHEG